MCREYGLVFRKADDLGEKRLAALVPYLHMPPPVGINICIVICIAPSVLIVVNSLNSLQ